MPDHRLALNNWREVEAYLDRSRFIIIPIGSTEQHGPNGLLGTDFICAEEIALRIAREMDALVAPTINVGMALHHMGFPGSMTLQPQTLIAVLRDVVSSLYQHGFRGFFFINGHGGNVSTAGAAFSAIREELPEAQIEWANWYIHPSVREVAKELFGDREGGHATPTEVALTMAAYPDAVEPIEEELDMEMARPRGIPGSQQFRKLYPDGRVGSDPSLATPEHGKRILEAAVAGIGKDARALEERVTPLQRG